MTPAKPSDGMTVNLRNDDDYLIQRDTRTQSPWYTYTPADVDGTRTYLGCASKLGHAHQLIARHRSQTNPTVPTTAHPVLPPLVWISPLLLDQLPQVGDTPSEFREWWRGPFDAAACPQLQAVEGARPDADMGDLRGGASTTNEGLVDQRDRQPSGA